MSKRHNSNSSGSSSSSSRDSSLFLACCFCQGCLQCQYLFSWLNKQARTQTNTCSSACERSPMNFKLSSGACSCMRLYVHVCVWQKHVAAWFICIRSAIRLSAIVTSRVRLSSDRFQPVYMAFAVCMRTQWFRTTVTPGVGGGVVCCFVGTWTAVLFQVFRYEIFLRLLWKRQATWVKPISGVNSSSCTSAQIGVSKNLAEWIVFSRVFKSTNLF